MLIRSGNYRVSQVREGGRERNRHIHVVDILTPLTALKAPVSNKRANVDGPKQSLAASSPYSGSHFRQLGLLKVKFTNTASTIS